MRLIVTSQTDIAGSNVYKRLSEGFGFRKDGEFEGMPVCKKGNVLLIATERGQTEANHLDRFFSPDYYVFASRHKSESLKKTLTVHVTGNLTIEAKVGGRPKELSYANSGAMKAALLELDRGMREIAPEYTVSMEATHHGPTELKRPVLFVEVGSTEAEWRDKNAIEVVSKAALAAAESRQDYPRGIGIGGNHYAPLHTKAVLGTDISIGHIIPAYAISALSKDIFLEAIERTSAEFGFLDWKGMRKEHRGKIKRFARECGLKLKRGRDIEKAPAYPEFEIEEEFFRVAEKAGRKIISDAITKLGAVPKTDANGRLSSRFCAPHDLRREVIMACIEALKQKYEIEYNGSLILKEEKLDLKKAGKLGIKPGPILGKIARGQKVIIDGKTITKKMLVKEVIKTVQIKEGITLDVIKKIYPT
ncbi:MAG: D-aminoacyl-tRNA deacylase [Candidatus Hydrothermarchaeaceae archaeon]